MNNKYKIGDKVVVKSNSYYTTTPVEIISTGFNPLLGEIYYTLKGISISIRWREHELVPEEIWNSPLYKVMNEDE